jgi:cysteinyl-tRNA synthetase
MQLYNSLARRKQNFTPHDPQRVTMYVCGPTVYSYPHIGNARPAVVFDVLYRLLRQRFATVVYARNITDLDDKINAAAATQGVAIEIITQRFTRVYHEDMEALGVLPPDVEPRATAHIPEMIAIIRSLIDSGHAYTADGHVLFHVPSFPDYGRLSRRDRREMLAGARVEVAPYKRDDADFVLWKPSTPGQPAWDSPWGPGRPGWHTECVCMIEKHLGPTIDIHGGGHDLQFPHHENEIAQARCAHHDAPLARFWMHNGFVNVNAEKMSKSIGNVLLVRDLLAEAPGEAIRFALLSAHYRKPLDWNEDTLPRACKALDRMYAALEGSPAAAGARGAGRRSEHAAGDCIAARDGTRDRIACRRRACAGAGQAARRGYPDGAAAGRHRRVGGCASRRCARGGRDRAPGARTRAGTPAQGLCRRGPDPRRTRCARHRARGRPYGHAVAQGRMSP